MEYPKKEDSLKHKIYYLLFTVAICYYFIKQRFIVTPLTKSKDYIKKQKSKRTLRKLGIQHLVNIDRE